VWRAAQPVSEQRTLRRATAGLLVAFVVLVVLSAALPSLL
jgi:hypothetical protein